MTVEEIIIDLKKHRNEKNIIGMSHFGINIESTLGLSMPMLRSIGKEIGTDHYLALELWKTGIHDARILSTIIDDPPKVTKTQMNKWVKNFNSWDLCDQCCSNLFRKTEFAVEYSFKWAESNIEFTKRAGFVLMAVLAVHNKKLTDEDFRKYFPLIINHSTDERNFVKKAANWALRQIGKRNLVLNSEAREVAENLISSKSNSAKWIGQDALRELNSEKIKKRLN